MTDNHKRIAELLVEAEAEGLGLDKKYDLIREAYTILRNETQSARVAAHKEFAKTIADEKEKRRYGRLSLHDHEDPYGQPMFKMIESLAGDAAISTDRNEKINLLIKITNLTGILVSTL